MLPICVCVVVLIEKLCFYISCYVDACCISRRLVLAMNHGDGRNPFARNVLHARDDALRWRTGSMRQGGWFIVEQAA